MRSQAPPDANEPVARDDRPRVVLCDDDPHASRAVVRVLTAAGFAVEAHGTGEELLAALERGADAFDVVLTDLMMPGISGLDVLAQVRERHPGLPVILMSGHASVAAAVDAMRGGALDYLVKPFESSAEVVARVARAGEHRRLQARNRFLESQLSIGSRFEGILGRSPAFEEVLSLVERVAPTEATVLVLGESGTGKERIARAIHDRSARRARSFVAVNCSAMTPTLVESELFGHVKGAFTGADAARRGLFEEAAGGTLFLDEVGELAATTQAQLLRVVQEREIRPVGSSIMRKVDVRLVAATHRDLSAMVKAGTFREDLLYRLRVVSVEIPPLRDRPSDIPEMAAHFLARIARKHARPVDRIAPAAMEALLAWRWPGNVRELENVIERAVVVARGESLGLESLPREMRERRSTGGVSPVGPFTDAKAEAVTAFELRYVERLLRDANGNVGEAARIAGLDRANFRRLVRRTGIDVDRFRTPSE